MQNRLPLAQAFKNHPFQHSRTISPVNLEENPFPRLTYNSRGYNLKRAADESTESKTLVEFESNKELVATEVASFNKRTQVPASQPIFRTTA